MKKNGVQAELGRETGVPKQSLGTRGSSLKLRGKPCLFADFVGGDAVQGFMAFPRDGLEVVGVDGVISAFPQ